MPPASGRFAPVAPASLAGGFGAARVLVVDDDEANIRVLQHVLRQAGYTEVRVTTYSPSVAALYLEFQPDLILLDLHMPHLDGLGVMAAVAPLVPAGTYLPILMLTADVTAEAKRAALASGATDFVTKPIDVAEVVARIRNLLHARYLNQNLEAEVRARTAEVESARMEVVERLALATEYRDDATGQHTRRVARTSGLLAQLLGEPPSAVELIEQAAPLHDVGKIAVPDAVLLKPGRLTPEELALVRAHTTIGSRLLSGGRFPLLRVSEEIARTHHERYDGGGYPAGLAGDAIPLAGRVVAVADVFDALTHARPYKEAWPVARAVAEVAAQAGRQFDPRAVEAFLALPHAELV